MIAFEKMAEVWYDNKVANILHIVLDYEIILCDNFKIWKSWR